MTEYKETINDRNWPGQIPRYFQGHGSEAEVLKAAEDTGNNGSVCAAYLLTGMWRVVHDDQAGAMPLLKTAAEKCSKNSPDGRFVRNELEKIAAKDNSK